MREISLSSSFFFLRPSLRARLEIELGRTEKEWDKSGCRSLCHGVAAFSSCTRFNLFLLAFLHRNLGMCLGSHAEGGVVLCRLFYYRALSIAFSSFQIYPLCFFFFYLVTAVVGAGAMLCKASYTTPSSFDDDDRRSLLWREYNDLKIKSRLFETLFFVLSLRFICS